MKYIFITLLTLTLASAASVPPPEAAKTELSADKWTYTNVAAVGIATLAFGGGVIALISLISPFFFYNLCFALGGCQRTLDTYVDQLMGFDGTKRINKRSLEYMEPLLTTLANAYDQYADGDVKKKFKKLKF